MKKLVANEGMFNMEFMQSLETTAHNVDETEKLLKRK